MDASGPLPVRLTELRSLRFLNISNNAFNGALPLNLSELTNLEVFDAYNNNLSGPLPLAFTRISGLRYLDLGGNYFAGNIPEDYSDITSLQYLGLHGNSLSGRIPASLGLLQNLTTLRLGYYNVFDGGIPAELGNLKQLVYLDISSCNISGRIPPELGGLRNLEIMFLHANALSGPLPKELGALKRLASLDLSNNNLEGEIPDEFKGLTSLKLLNLFMNRLHGEVPEFIADLKNLEVLQLWQNNFTGSLPQRLGMNGRLNILDVSSNKLIGRIPLHLCQGERLQVLVLMNNWFMGPIPESLGHCKSLVRVRLGQNYINGSIPRGLLYLPRLSFIELLGNYLTGPIPAAGHTAGTSSLGHLDLSNNRLSGALPASIGNFQNAQIVLASCNQLSGAIPGSMGHLQTLTRLDLSSNRLEGSIPKEIAECKSLTYVDLSRNRLNGSIPDQLCTMRMLDYLNVSRNLLTGPVSGKFAVMQSLTAADFSYNNLTGFVPNVGQFAYFNASAFAGNPGLCGPLLDTCSNIPTSGKIFEKRMPSASMKLALVIGIVLCSIIFISVAIAKTRRKWKSAYLARTSWKLTSFQKLDFTGDDVRECMKEDNVIGRGGAGVVYRGLMPNGQEVAVKKLNVPPAPKSKVSSASVNDHGFAAEIQTLGNIRHRNIVRLLAVCSNHETNLLVYEYMPNGSLGDVLHGSKGGHLHWQTRYKIALDAARGLRYLHHDCSPMIVHRDVKSTNILLDSNLEAHVADFGLAKFFLSSSDTSQCMSAVAGSYGYIAPEYAYTLKVDEKSDVYSFGVVMLELITGKKAVGEFGEGVNIVQWVRKTGGSESEVLKRIVDTRLSSVPLDEALHMLWVAMLCVNDHSVERPTMREVVQMLSDPPKIKPRQYFSPSSNQMESLSPKKTAASLPAPDLIQI
eukprot:TRINITY_DN17119_c0_g1_i1.p1 TRINITY_DN17119_c0_g1~~TRINITY_DN17119_c0_g1_i1.p1  ORF type:complete len:989 (-),score=21.86 TRINITY_DN17119_c0_g1_i1:104-2839(-)